MKTYENDRNICSERTNVEKQPFLICQSSSQHDNTLILQEKEKDKNGGRASQSLSHLYKIKVYMIRRKIRRKKEK